MQLSRRKFCLSLALGAGGAAIGWGLTGRQRTRQGGEKRSGRVPFAKAATALGTRVEITALHDSRERAARAVEAAFGELDLVEEVMSLYRPHSQLSRLNREGTLTNPHPYLVTVLQSAQELSARSGGKFDVTVQPLWRLHNLSARQGRTARAAEIAAATRLVDWRQLDITPQLIRFRKPGMAATLNGIAQGFAADRALCALQQHGIEHALVNTGELASLGSNSSGDPWRVGIQHPRQEDAFIALAELDSRVLATSGDYATRFGNESGLHHLLDPDTGTSARDFSSVSILAPSGLLADGLSTAAFVLGPEQGMDLVRATPQADMFCVLPSGHTLATPGFPLRQEEAGA